MGSPKRQPEHVFERTAITIRAVAEELRKSSVFNGAVGDGSSKRAKLFGSSPAFHTHRQFQGRYSRASEELN